MPFHAPNAALLIDFDNVTMGVRSDLNAELRNLLSSDIVKGKVSVQRAYADWRRYPQYIVPLAESSIDLIFAPAYGSSKKNATDIRLAIDALELVFTRPEIGTFILLSGDSDFSSLVIKLKEYGKYVIGVGIRESSSDLLVQNCDEYYSYNALAGLVNTREEEVAKWDPWELAGEAVQRMKRNGDVMRADRLKQVMQQIDSSFDEKNLGMSKFTRFVQEASHRGILSAHKMENGQLEVDLARSASASAPSASATATGTTTAAASTESGTAPDDTVEPGIGSDIAAEPREHRDRERGRRGRGRGRDREERRPRVQSAAGNADLPPLDVNAAANSATDVALSDFAATTPSADSSFDPELHPPAAPASRAESLVQLPEDTEPGLSGSEPRGSAPVAEAVASEADAIGAGGMRLTRDDAFNLMRDAVNRATAGGIPARANEVRRVAREILGRDSESLSERNFNRILMDAHDADVIDLRRRGNDYEVSAAIAAAPIADQLGAAETAAAILSPRASAPPAPRGMGQRGAPPRGGRSQAAKPPLTLDLLSVGVVDYDAPSAAPTTSPTVSATTSATTPPIAPPSAPASAATQPAVQHTQHIQHKPADAPRTRELPEPQQPVPVAAPEPAERAAGRSAAKTARPRKTTAKKTAARPATATTTAKTGAAAPVAKTAARKKTVTKK